MCGIFGAVNFAGRALRDPRRIRAMADTIIHRGPDAGGHLEEGGAILGSRRLAIVDLSPLAKQPFTSPGGDVWLVCNGEIYNAPSIRERYAARGYPFRSDHNDVEPILPLYLEHGERAVEHLDGMFALAIWDRRQRRLLLARDRAGEKPLFWQETGGELRFASEIQALLAGDGALPEVSRAGLSDYLALGYCTAPDTMFEGIRKVEAAQQLVFDAGGRSARRYWDAVGFASHQVATAPPALLAALTGAVERQLNADVPLGVFLSGGLDSSLLATEVVRRAAPGTVNTYAVSFEREGYDESDWAAKVAQRLGTVHHRVHASEAELRRALDYTSERMAEPIGDPAVLPTYLLSEAAARDVKVVLSGEGADELFGGYPTYLGHRWARRFARLPAVLRTPIRGIVRRLPTTTAKVSLSFLARRFVEDAERDLEQRHMAWFGALGPEAERLAVDYRPPAALESWLRLAPIADPVKKVMVFDLFTYLAENLLSKVDRATMLASIEARAPFLDRSIMELALAQPAGSAVGNVSMKMALKKAAEARLPRDIIHRRKRGLSVPVSDLINNGLRNEFNAMLEPARLSAQGLIRPEPVTQLLQEHRSGRADHGRRLWPLFILQRWHHRWLESFRGSVDCPSCESSVPRRRFGTTEP
jgi:asparagine synthase (glutamine-hydrolysing)